MVHGYGRKCPHRLVIARNDPHNLWGLHMLISGPVTTGLLVSRTLYIIAIRFIDCLLKRLLRSFIMT